MLVELMIQISRLLNLIHSYTLLKKDLNLARLSLKSTDFYTRVIIVQFNCICN